MNIRVIPVLISLTITSVILFGGWYTYRSVALEKPLSDVVQQLPNVADVDMKLEQDRLILDLVLQPDANIAEIMSIIREDAETVLQDRTLSIHMKGEISSSELDTWWSEQLFDIAEAMELRQYAQIPAVLDARKEELSGLEVEASIDEENVYIKLLLGDASKFIMLPRNPVMIGVWSHE